MTLLTSLSPAPTRHRGGVRRKLQRMGAVRLGGSAWILPENPETTDLFQWPVQEIAAGTEDDHEVLERGLALFDGLYTMLKRKT